MSARWDLIRQVMSRTIDACEAVDELDIDLFAGEYEARSDFQDDVCVGDFLSRFWQYPEGCQRDIIRIRARLGYDQKHLPEIARALIAAACACAEAIGVPDECLEAEAQELEPHCGSAGRSIGSQLRALGDIQNGWMLTGMTRAIEQFRKST
jgi:hypothetical protein